MSRRAAPHVLVLDDTASASVLGVAFEQAGCRVSFGTSAIAAADVARHETLDGAVVSFRISEDRGDAVFYRLIALQPHLGGKIVFLTLSDIDAEIATATGCPWLHKLVDPQTVVDIVRRLMGQTGDPGVA